MASWRDRVRLFFGQAADVGSLGRGPTVTALVPPEARYITVGPLLVLHDATRFLGGPPGQRRYGRDLGWVPEVDGERLEVGLLVLAGRNLSVYGAGGVRWSTDAAQIAEVDGHRASGFVVVARDAQGVAVGPQSPVETPPGCSWRTVSGVTNLFAGWDSQLEPLGAQVRW